MIEKAKYRLKYVTDKRIDKNTAQFILEDAYEASREAAQSLMSVKGFKPYSHEATIAFVKENYNEFNDKDIYDFDKFRKLRHDSIYKAEPVSEEDARQSILFASNFVKKVKSIFEKD